MGYQYCRDCLLIPLGILDGYQLFNSLFRDVFAGSLRSVVQKDGDLTLAAAKCKKVLNQLLIKYPGSRVDSGKRISQLPLLHGSCKGPLLLSKRQSYVNRKTACGFLDNKLGELDFSRQGLQTWNSPLESNVNTVCALRDKLF